MQIAKDVGDYEQSAVTSPVKGSVGKSGRDVECRGVDIALVIGGVPFHSVDIPVTHGLEHEAHFAVGNAVIIHRVTSGKSESQDDREEKFYSHTSAVMQRAR